MTPRAARLRVAPDLSWSEDQAGKTFCVLAQRGAGKSNVLAVMAEEMYGRVPWVVIDPKGDWHGIRSGADGKPDGGLHVPIFGGLRKDADIRPTDGGELAAAIFEDNITCVVDVSDFTKGERLKFLLGFFDRMYNAHRREPVLRHLFLEEAHEYLPQELRGKGENELAPAVKEAGSRCVLLGRSFGLGSTTASQRSARLHNDVLTQSDTLIALRTIAPPDRKAVLEWVRYQGESMDRIAPTLANLADGEAWVWTPPADPVRVRFRRRQTFDSGASPGAGAKRVIATLADIDVGALEQRFAAAVEKAKAEDPVELRKTIRALEKELAKKAAVVNVPLEVEKIVEVPAIPQDVLDTLAKLVDAAGDVYSAALALDQQGTQLGFTVEKLRKIEDWANARGAGSGSPRAATRGRTGPATGSSSVGASSSPRPAKPASDSVDAKLGKGERITLTAIAQHDAGVTRPQLTVLTGYKRATRNTYLQRLGAAGFIESSPEGRIFATADGVAALGDDFDPLPTGEALREKYVRELPEGERRILAELIAAWPEYLTRDELTERTGYSRATRNTYIQRMNAKEIIDVRGSDVFASERLFEEHEK